MNSKLYVGNLSFKATEADLTDLFSAHGKVVSSRIVTDKETPRRSTGWWPGCTSSSTWPNSTR